MHQQYQVEPIAEGTLRLASLIISKEISIIKISKIIGKGTLSLEATKIEYNNLLELFLMKISNCNIQPGNNKVIKTAKSLKTS